ncbi:MAG: DUF3791 domain-containing protein [Christensenellaceae bacterium]|jgi:hypothetical protein|nr:DUF3791 domain-containing protein [Christensenellaceae bacterium]
MAFKETDPVLFMQTQITRLYRKRHSIGIREFNELDRKIDILGFIEIGYEQFHLTGEEGILDEIDDYCRLRLSQNR